MACQLKGIYFFDLRCRIGVFAAQQKPETELYEAADAAADDSTAPGFSLRLLPPYSGEGCQIPAAQRAPFLQGRRTVAPTPTAAGGVACSLALPGGVAVAATFVPYASQLQAGWPQVHEALQLAPGDVVRFSQLAASADDIGSRFSVTKLPRPAQTEAAAAEGLPRPSSNRVGSGVPAVTLSGDRSTASWRLPGGCDSTLRIAAAALDAWGVQCNTACTLVLEDGQQLDSTIHRRPMATSGSVAYWAKVAAVLQPRHGDMLHMRAALLEPLEVHLLLARAAAEQAVEVAAHSAETPAEGAGSPQPGAAAAPPPQPANGSSTQAAAVETGEAVQASGAVSSQQQQSSSGVGDDPPGQVAELAPQRDCGKDAGAHYFECLLPLPLWC